jgi:drug/metabolite transporter (DMT)-like permease
MVGLSRFAACLLVVSAAATVGGALFAVLHGGTTVTRAIAYAFWIAAAVALVGMAGAASKGLGRRFDMPFIEGWLFIAASVLLTGIGVVVDVLGSP